MASDAEFEQLRREYLARLERPLEALETLRELRATLVRLERLLVREARHRYSTWTEIGDALGVSRQAARRRHCPPVRERDGV